MKLTQDYNNVEPIKQKKRRKENALTKGKRQSKQISKRTREPQITVRYTEMLSKSIKDPKRTLT